MSSYTPHDEVQHELEGVSPLLAGIRNQQPTNGPDMDTLHALGQAALEAVPLEKSGPTLQRAPMQVVHRKRKWLGLVAAAVAMMLGTLLTFSIYNASESPSTEFASNNISLSEELIASYEEQTADPIAFLLDDELSYIEDEDLFFSPAEDVLLDWADDGYVEDALSEEVMFDVVW